MSISQTYYDLEKEVRNKYGEQWHRILDADHPMVVAMRNSLETVAEEESETKVKPKRKLIKAYRSDVHLGNFQTIKECVEKTGISRYIIARKLRGLPVLEHDEYTFEFVEE